ncbi:gamma-glutamyl-gamma-aminobutyrate hydrolase family protein [Anaerosporobacter faecicola]|uniref:gamma-glutamyl-gamma-aminobutyrate hydrolase family protein n=1 Tax=Anaerosporobacter faecicola TaxID=2718714 RepID=UPI00143BA488|nr:gamma-glutamyl-gamma-aminobutyrate hydrolase family protein [Anaerosporobacter faecicola]
MTTSPVIGVLANITFADHMGTDHMYVNDEYVLALEKVHATPIIIPPIMHYDLLDTYINLCDGFLLSGGIDINPIYFNQEPSKRLGTVNNKLDAFQIALVKKILRTKKPFLGICRGIQLVNICLGGTIYQDLDDVDTPTILHMQKAERYRGIHKVTLTTGSKLHSLFGDVIFVNSYHHQAVAIPGRQLNVVGVTSDHIIEAIELQDHPYGIAVQWHPEMMFARTDEMRELFESFVNACHSR